MGLTTCTWSERGGLRPKPYICYGPAVKAFGYVRISKMDEGTTSPQRQRAAIEKWCADRDVALVDTFEDLDLSAYSRRVRRPGLERLLGRLGEVDTIVTWRLDRLARSVSGFSKLLETFDAAGVKLATTDGQVDMTTAAGRAMVQMTAVFAELEAGTTSERARQMHAYKRERGEWVGNVPFGFRRVGKTIEPDPERFSILVDASRRYVAGESLRRISADAGIHHPNLARALRSDRVVDALPPEVAAPLVAAMAERGRTGTRAKRSLLGGIARCGVCGAGLTIVGDRRTSNGRRPWSAYGCRERGHVHISSPWLDRHVTEQVLAAIDTGKLLKRLDRRKRPPQVRVASELEARLELLERDHYERGIIARESYLRRREGILKRLEAARTAEANAGIDLPRELALNLSERWDDLTVHGRRRIVGAVIERIDVAKASTRSRIDPDRVAVIWRA
jgi:DNA invertase Pin-like site-specific DNA recombinase